MAEKILVPLVDGSKIQLQKNVDALGALQIVEPDEGFTSIKKLQIKNTNLVQPYYNINGGGIEITSWQANQTNAFTSRYVRLCLPLPTNISSQIATLRGEDINTYAYAYFVSIYQSDASIEVGGGYQRCSRDSAISWSNSTSIQPIPDDVLQTFTLSPTSETIVKVSTSNSNTVGLMYGTWGDSSGMTQSILYIPLTTKYYIYAVSDTSAANGYGWKVSLKDGFHEGAISGRSGYNMYFDVTPGTSSRTVSIPSNC